MFIPADLASSPANSGGAISKGLKLSNTYFCVEALASLNSGINSGSSTLIALPRAKTLSPNLLATGDSLAPKYAPST